VRLIPIALWRKEQPPDVPDQSTYSLDQVDHFFRFLGAAFFFAFFFGEGKGVLSATLRASL
jgi:hypothetical protein